MHKCDNYHAIIHKLYTWFGKNELKLYLNKAKISSIGGTAPAAPSKYAHGQVVTFSSASAFNEYHIILHDDSGPM